MMLGFFSFLYAGFAMMAIGSFLWGIGSGMMNGIRYRSLGTCMVTAAVSAGLSWGCLEVATILMNQR